ncbi:MAG: hypothetical protein ACR2PX_02155 [Endozoicomonas sp.]|uniref:hypothetical protein n=1 Tax=Endozoicomonas sp. TaxID=1892382 RepID=UPI003D9B3BCF
MKKTRKLLPLILCFLTFNAWPLDLNKHDKHYSVRYSYTGKKIDYKSVCSNYTKGSTEYRGCRGQAQGYFKDQCTDYRKRYRMASSSSKKDVAKKRDMYCLAKSQFNPLR